MFQKRLLCVVLACLALAAACSPAATPPPAPTAASTEAAKRAPVLRLEDPGDADVSDIPRLLAMDALKAQGYQLELRSFDSTSLSIVALDQGDLDMATVSNESGWSAMQKEAKIVLVLDESNNSSLVLTRTAIQTCADLDGKRVGVSGLSGSRYTMLHTYIEDHCPDIKPDYLVMAGSGNRLAALLAGELDATVADLGDWVEMSAQQQEDVHTLVFFSDEYPGLSTTSAFAGRAFAEQYPDTVKDVIRATLEARRKVQDPQVLAGEMVKRFEMDPAAAASAAQFYLERKLWDVNGYTIQEVQNNLDFLIKSGTLPAGLQAQDVADLSFQDAVLDEIGRQ